MRGPYEDPQLDPQQTEQTRLRRCLLYGFGDYCGKGTKLFDVLTGDQELEVHRLITDLKLTSHSTQNPVHVTARPTTANVFNTQQNQYNSRPTVKRIKYGFEFKEVCKTQKVRSNEQRTF